MTVTALIVAAGRGTRIGAAVPKQFRLIAGRPVLRWAVEALLFHPRVDAVRVVVGAGQEDQAAEVLHGLDVGAFITGGAERSDSVRNGLNAIGDGIVLIHDAARPFCPPLVIDRLLDALDGHDGAVPALPVADTLAEGDRLLSATVSRRNLLRIQTPQAFHVEDLQFAFDETAKISATDESSIMIAAGLKVITVAGDSMLDKITTEADIARAERLVQGQFVSRSGSGFDVHAFGGEGPLVLGGITVPHGRGLRGHSDADVALHAITDALFGAAALGDLGDHFPPSDPEWKGAPSDRFLRHAAELIRSAGGIIDHVDCTIIAEEPKVAPHRAAMRARIAEILQLESGQVSVKATTTEGLGWTGRGEGIAAQATATVRMLVVGR